MKRAAEKKSWRKKQNYPGKEKTSKQQANTQEIKDTENGDEFFLVLCLSIFCSVNFKIFSFMILESKI